MGLKTKDKFDLMVFINLALFLVLISLAPRESYIDILAYIVGLLFVTLVIVMLNVAPRYLYGMVSKSEETFMHYLVNYGATPLMITAALWGVSVILILTGSDHLAPSVMPMFD